MQDVLNKFISDYTGKQGVGTTPENTGQCVGLIQVWLKLIYPNAPYIWGHAKDLFANASDSHYVKIKNTPSGVPMFGDVITWNSNLGGGFGHTAVVISADLNKVTVFEQNTNPKAPHVATYNYNNVIGWFRPKDPVISSEKMATITQKELDQLRMDRDTHYNDLQKALKEADENRKARDSHWNDLTKARETIDSLNWFVKDKDSKLTTLQNDLSEKDKQLLGKTQTIESLTEQAKKLVETQKLLEQAETARTQCLNAQESQNRQIAQLRNSSYTTADTKVLMQEIVKRLFRK